MTWYDHMFGADMGDMYAYATDDTGEHELRRSIGAQGINWNWRCVDLTRFVGKIVDLKFRMIAGFERSEMAIDTVRIQSVRSLPAGCETPPN